MNKIELLAPAKDIEKAKIALIYGADAVYIGGERFSLRYRASNFTLNNIEEITKFAKSMNKKVYVTVNMVFHDEDFIGLKEYLINLENIGVDGIIISSLSILQIAKDVAPKLERHISTQLSINNSSAIKVLKAWGADRVVLAREASLSQIKEISHKVDLPLEVFIHGGMCSNYSGRCFLSNRMTNRDANRGGCAHSCRWKYDVYKNNEMISDAKCPFSMSSKDLRASHYINELMEYNIASLKIEGRMKSEYYIAQVVRTYRKMIDEIYEKGKLSQERLAYYDRELLKAENRPSDDGFFSGYNDNSKHLYGENGAGVTHEYVAFVHAYDTNRDLALIEVKNIFSIGDTLEVIGQEIDNERFINTVMFDEDWNLLKTANKPTSMIYLRTPIKLRNGDMIRKVNNDYRRID